MTDRDSRVVLIGAGGHGRVCADVFRAAGWVVEGFIDAQLPAGSPVGSDWKVLGGHELLDDPNWTKVRAFFVSVGNNDTRARLADELRARGLRLASAVHPFSWISPSVTIGSNVVVMPGAVVNYGSRLADDVVINTGATVDHDCPLAQGVQVGPGAHISGTVPIGARSFIGTGASTVQSISIGRDVIVGAGAAVIESLPDGVTAVGVPARIIERRSGGG